MIVRAMTYADRVLRAEPTLIRPDPHGKPSLARRLASLAAVMLAFGTFYGGMMGTFGGVAPQRLEQIAYSAIKVPMLLTVTFALSLPSFFVINTLLGLRDDFGRVLRALVASQAGLTIVLASLAPITVFWYASVPSYGLAKLFNTGVFGIASLAGQLQLKRYYRPLIAELPRHRWMMRTWLVIYAFVGVQMAWVLRPFIGAPAVETRFFRSGAWGNAYTEMADLIARLLGG